MPNRIVRDGINDSKAISSLSDSGEILYRRLMSIVDDYGRYEADADLIRARCFPRCLERWPVQRVYDALQETNLTIGSDGLPLVILYTNGSKTYLQINNFGQRVRTESKFPAPTARDVVRHPLTNVSGTPTAVAHARARSESESETYAESEAYAQPETTAGAAAPSCVRVMPSPPTVTDLNGITSDRFEEFWELYPLKQRRDFACREFLSVVTIDTEAAFFACLKRYLASDQVSRGVIMNPDKWIREQHYSQWQGNWPAPARAAPRLSPSAAAFEELERRIASGQVS